MKDRILNLLGQGIAPVIVAQTVGCNPSYISQLLQEEEFALAVAKLRCEGIEKEVNRDNKYDALEDKLLEKLENVLPFMLKPRDILDALTRINAAKRRATVGVSETGTGKTTIINLTLPTIVVQKYQTNQNNEVIDVSGRALINLPPQTLLKSLENLEAKDATPPPLPKLSSEQVKRAAITEDSV